MPKGDRDTVKGQRVVDAGQRSEGTDGRGSEETMGTLEGAVSRGMRVMAEHQGVRK